MKTDISTIKEFERLFQEYEQEVLTAQNSGYLQPNTTRTYLLHSGNFVKWCKDEFEPGAKISKSPSFKLNNKLNSFRLTLLLTEEGYFLSIFEFIT